MSERIADEVIAGQILAITMTLGVAGPPATPRRQRRAGAGDPPPTALEARPLEIVSPGRVRHAAGAAACPARDSRWTVPAGTVARAC